MVVTGEGHIFGLQLLVSRPVFATLQQHALSTRHVTGILGSGDSCHLDFSIAGNVIKGAPAESPWSYTGRAHVCR